MIETTDALVLHRLRYSDTSHIACLYTRKYGRVSYIIPAIAERTARTRTNTKKNVISRLVSPPAELQITVDHRSNKELQYIRDASLINPYQSTRIDPIKHSIVFFLGEVLYRILPEPQADSSLYDFLSRSFVVLECSKVSPANFHLCFLWHLLLHLGFSPDGIESDTSVSQRGMWFDLIESSYSSMPPQQGIPPQQASFLPVFARIDFSNYHAYRFSRTERGEILAYLLNYYRIHLPRFATLRSLSVLSDLFD